MSYEGLIVLKDLYLKKHFGGCPRVLCAQSPLIPYGQDYEELKSRLMLYCDNCQEIYKIDTNIDGSCYGPDLCHLFLLTFADEFNLKNQKLPIAYKPRIFGFKIKGVESKIKTKAQSGVFGF